MMIPRVLRPCQRMCFVRQLADSHDEQPGMEHLDRSLEGGTICPEYAATAAMSRPPMKGASAAGTMSTRAVPRVARQDSECCRRVEPCPGCVPLYPGFCPSSCELFGVSQVQ